MRVESWVVWPTIRPAIGGSRLATGQSYTEGTGKDAGFEPGPLGLAGI